MKGQDKYNRTNSAKLLRQHETNLKALPMASEGTAYDVVRNMFVNAQDKHQEKVDMGIRSGVSRRNSSTENKNKIVKCAMDFLKRGREKRCIVSLTAKRLGLSKNLVRTTLQSEGILPPRKHRKKSN